MKICLFLTWFAVICVCLTPLASIAWLAHTLVATHCVVANGTVAARGLHTFIDIDFTCLTLKEEKEGKKEEENS